MKPKLYIVTGAPFKFHDMEIALRDHFDCEQRTIDDPEIQGEPEEIIKHKLKVAYEKFKHPVLVDDVSVHIEHLNGFPGPYMKDLFKCFTPYEMGHKFAGSRIKAICRLGLQRGPEDVVIAEGEFNGKIIAPKDKDHKDRFFELFVQLDGTDRVMLDYTTEEKNEFSHRGMAMKKLIEVLEQSNSYLLLIYHI